MTTPTDSEKMAQALRELLDSHDHAVECYYADQRAADEREAAARVAARELLAAHERAQPAKPDGYAYRYADGFLRFNQGAPVNGGKPIEAIPFYFAPPAQPASVAAPAEWREFVSRVAAQGPSKPDYWSSCAQCERNASDAEDLLAAAPQPAKGDENGK